MNLVRTTIAGIVLTLATSVSQAQIIAINPTSGDGPTGATINFSFNASDFATTGGAFDLTWDTTVLTYNGDFAFDPGFGIPPRDPVFDVNDLQAPGLLSIGFGDFGGITFGPTPTTIGSLSFTMGGAPGDSSALTIVDSTKWGGFFDLATGDLIPMTYNGATATNPVPIPAAVWLFGSGLLGLVGVTRKKKQRA